MFTFKTAAPEETGIPSRCITRFLQRLEAREIPMHSIHLLHHDKLIAEGYYAPCQANTLHRMFSVSKNFTSIAIALLAEEGKLSLSDCIVKYFPDKVPKQVHPWIASMTIRDMLMMRTCHASTTYKLDMTKDWVESFFTTPPTHPAGRLFHYDTSSAHTLCALAERLSGMPMLDYLKQKLSPLEFSASSYMVTDPFGVSLGGSGLVATPVDLLKFGYLIAHKGNVGGIQLVPASYIETAVSHLTDTRVTAPIMEESCGYGYQFWRNSQNGYTCYGMGGQLIIFLPDYDLICVTTADTQGIGGGNQPIYDALYEEILPCISETPLPAQEEEYRILQKQLADLKISPVRGKVSSPIADAVSGICFAAAENPLGFSRLRLTFPETASLSTDDDGKASAENETPPVFGGSLSFTLNGTEYSLPFGIGQLVSGTFPIYGFHCAASGAWLADRTFYLKVHIIDSSVGSVHFQFSFGDGESGRNLTLFMKKQEESLLNEFSGHLYFTTLVC